MNAEEVKAKLDELKAQGLSEEEILDALYDMFLDGELSKEDLGKVIGTIGYELSPEFDAVDEDEPIDLKEKGVPVDAEVPEDVSKDEIEKAKEIPSTEGEEESEEPEEGLEDEEEDEKLSEDEKTKARSLYGL